MEALVVRKLGDPTTRDWESSPIVLSKEEAIPAFESPTAVRVRVKATSLNYANYLQIQGKYQEKPPLPFIPGSDYSGVVDAVGPKVSQFKVGDPMTKGRAGAFSCASVDYMETKKCSGTWWTIEGTELAE
nr:quinone oxidoreductase-like protein 2 [Quercus suber]